jgi:hypothetical protein
MATGLVVADTDISVGGRTSPGAMLARVKTYLFTEDSDLTVNSSIPVGIQFGDPQTIIMPVKGFIGLGFAGSVSGVSSAFAMVIGLSDGTSTVWPKWVDNGSAAYLSGHGAGPGTSDDYTGVGQSSQFMFPISIEESGLLTGSRTITARVADNNDTNSHVVDGSGGTINPAQIYMSIWDFT